MKLVLHVKIVGLLIISFGLVSGAFSLKGAADNGSISTSCSPWFIPQENSSSIGSGGNDNNCTCGNTLEGIVTCSDEPERVELKECYCMTSDLYYSNRTVAGGCLYSCVKASRWYSDPRELNYYMCHEVWKRTGTLCSQCIEDHGPLVYSYELRCVSCPSRHSLVLFLGQFVLLTVFCLIILTLRISIARPPMSTFILVSQIMASPYLLQYMYVPLPGQPESPVSRTTRDTSWSLFGAFYGLWNLDIIRSFYPHICLSPKMSTLQAVLLEYVIAIFPILVLVVIYYSVSLYDGGCRAVFWLCRPFHTCLARLRQSIDVRTSLIDAFATFIILSMNKIGYTSVSILQPVRVFTPYGNYTRAAYLDPKMSYFGSQHIPYALLALALSLTLIIVPLALLLVYPSRKFQRLLNYRGWHCRMLHVFADSFQGCYKDGTSGTRDYRWFAALNISMRFIAILPLMIVESRHVLTYLLTVIGVALYMALLSIFQPYKKSVHLKQDMILLLGVIVWHIAIVDGFLDFTDWNRYLLFLHLILLGIGSLIPAVYLAGLILHWLLVEKRLYRWILNKLRLILNKTRLINVSSERVRLLEDSAQTKE